MTGQKHYTLALSAWHSSRVQQICPIAELSLSVVYPGQDHGTNRRLTPRQFNNLKLKRTFSVTCGRGGIRVAVDRQQLMVLLRIQAPKEPLHRPIGICSRPKIDIGDHIAGYRPQIISVYEHEKDSSKRARSYERIYPTSHGTRHIPTSCVRLTALRRARFTNIRYLVRNSEFSTG